MLFSLHLTHLVHYVTDRCMTEFVNIVQTFWWSWDFVAFNVCLFVCWLVL